MEKFLRFSRTAFVLVFLFTGCSLVASKKKGKKDLFEKILIRLNNVEKRVSENEVALRSMLIEQKNFVKDKCEADTKLGEEARRHQYFLSKLKK